MYKKIHTKFHKALLLLLSMFMVATASAGYTVANQHKQESTSDVMTVGRVEIEQLEYECVVKEDGSYEKVYSEKYKKQSVKIQPFTQDKPLYPAVGKTGHNNVYVYFDQLDKDHAQGGHSLYSKLKNIVDKFVLVKNTGNTDVYFRTIFAFEMGSLSLTDWDRIIEDGININNYSWSKTGVVNINGNRYYVKVALYNGAGTRHIGGILPPGDYSYNSLGQIYMESIATNEDCEAIDGNNNGAYDILVLSQAVQTKGFQDAQTALNTAFGTVNAANVQIWFADMATPNGNN